MAISRSNTSSPSTETQGAGGTGVELARLLDRPAGERAREYKYRLAQSLVFGLPVIGLQVWGPGLGGSESGRWIAIFQAILSGWVVYVGAAGVLFEAMLWLGTRGKGTGALIVSGAAVGMYVYSVIGTAALLLGRRGWGVGFHWVIVVVAVWSAANWWKLRRRERSALNE